MHRTLICCRTAVFAIHLAQRLLSAHVARAPCVSYILSALSLLYATRRGASRHGCQDSAEVRNFLVERGDSNRRASKSISPHGQTLYVRPIGDTKPTTHTFVPVETVARIAAQHGIPSRELLAANPGVAFNSLIESQTLFLPVDAGRPG